MAANGTGGAGGAHLASGYISLQVRYASAMKQVADDFGVMGKRAKETGESITKNLVAGADSAKAKVKELGSEYEAQRQKVAALKEEINKLGSAQAELARAEKAYREGYRRDTEASRRFKQEEVNLTLAVNKILEEGGAKRQASLEAWNAKYTELHSRRKAEMEELAALEKSLAQARKTASPEALEGERAAREQLNSEIKKGRELYEQYGKAVADATRKQELASVSSEGLRNNHSLGQRMAQRFGQMLHGEFSSAGKKAGQGFGHSLSASMHGAFARATQETAGKVRNMASGIFMGMTPGMMGAAGAGIALSKAFSAGFNREETINTVKLRMAALGHDQNTINSLVSQSTNSVVGTQYSLAESLTAAQTAMTAGIQVGPQMTQYLDNIANAAAITGEEYGIVADSINRVNMQGVASLENLQPLINKNLPVLKWLKEFYQQKFPATTQADITEMISKKLIPADVLNRVLSANLNNSMKDVGKQTVKGAFADLSTQIGKVSQSILAPFMGDWPSFINSIGDKLRRFSEYIKPGMEVAAAWIKKTWASVSAAAGTVVGKIVSFWKTLWPNIKKGIDMFVEVWRKTWPSVQKEAGPFFEAFKRNWDAVFPILKAVGAVIGWVAMQFIAHIPHMMRAITNVLNWLANAKDWMLKKFFPWIKDRWTDFTGWLKKASDKVGEWKDAVVDAFNWVKEHTASAWNWLEGKLNWLSEKMAFFRDNAHWITDPLGSIADAFSGSGGGGGNVTSYNLMSHSTPLPGASPGGTFQMPTNANIQYGQSGFPDWVYQLGKAFNLEASTYENHQGGKGIDWKGAADDMQRFADYLTKVPGMEQVIFMHPQTGRKTGVVDGKRVGPGTDQPGYYRNDWGGHTDHVHTRTSTPIPLPGLVRGSPGQGFPLPWKLPPITPTGDAAYGFNWDAVAAKESSGDWDNNNTGGHMTSSGAPRGGLQITDGTWKAFGGLEFAPAAHLASKAEQVAVANRIAFSGYKGTPAQGLGAWEVIANGSTAADGITVNSKPGLVRGSPGQGFPLPWKLGPGANLNDPSPSITDILLGNLSGAGSNPSVVRVPSLPGAILGNMASDASGGGLNRLPMVSDVILGNAASSNSSPGMVHPSPVPQLGKWPMNIPGVTPYVPPGPKGTKDDPIVTTDPQVAENTDPDNPDNQVQPGSASDGGDGAGGVPHDGSGAMPGPSDGYGGAGYSTNGIQGALLGQAMPIGDIIAKGLFDDQFQGTAFSNPIQWPIVKSASALLKFIGGIFPSNEQIMSAAMSGGIPGIDPGSITAGGGTPATPKQIRDMDERVRDANEKVAKAKAEKDAMVGKPQYTDEERADAAAKLTEAERERTNVLLDQQGLMAQGGSGSMPQGLAGMLMGSQMLRSGFNLAGNVMGGNGSAAVGDVLGFVPQPWGNMVTGSPGIAPGDAGMNAVLPGGGGGSPIAGAASAIPSASDLQPGQQGSGGNTNIDMSVNQVVDTPGQTAAADVARRAQGAQLRSPVLALNGVGQ